MRQNSREVAQRSLKQYPSDQGTNGVPLRVSFGQFTFCLTFAFSGTFAKQGGVVRWGGMHWSWRPAPEVVDSFDQRVHHPAPEEQGDEGDENQKQDESDEVVLSHSSSSYHALIPVVSQRVLCATRWYDAEANTTLLMPAPLIVSLSQFDYPARFSSSRKTRLRVFSRGSRLRLTKSRRAKLINV